MNIFKFFKTIISDKKNDKLSKTVILNTLNIIKTCLNQIPFGKKKRYPVMYDLSLD